jgi:ATP-dependent DNA helicase RecG
VSALGEVEFSDMEFRALLEASRCGRIDNARMRQVTGLDTLSASRVLRRLCDRELLALHHAGAASYYELGPAVVTGESRSLPRGRAADPTAEADRGELRLR